MSNEPDQETCLIENLNQDESVKIVSKRSKYKEKDVITDFNDFICPSCVTSLQLTWTRVSFAYKKTFMSHFNLSNYFKPKTVLHQQSGFMKSRELTAIIGKSGCGKSTLLQCLSGRKTSGMSGAVWIDVNTTHPFNKSLKNLKICFLPQVDYLFDILTVRESFYFAFKIRNLNVNCNSSISSIIKDLDLEDCQHVAVGHCSGGERKRLSIGLELLGDPNILMLDEPTSGLDSVTAYQLVVKLKKLAQSPSKPIAIIASIHQPSAKLLQLFNNVYLLSHDGRRIYFGSYENMISRFKKLGLDCPLYCNPCDFAIEIASGDYGDDKINEMEKEQTQNDFIFEHGSSSLDLKTVVTQMYQNGKFQFSPFYYLLIRTLVMTGRDPILNGFRFAQHVFVALVAIWLYTDKIGTGNGCINKELTSFDYLRRQEVMVLQNVAFVFFSLLFLAFAAMMPTVMVFPLEISTFLKERKNCWYTCINYYLAKTLADLPYQVTYTIIYVIISYYGTGQFSEPWRFFAFLTVCIIISLIGQSLGLLFGTIFVKSINTAIFSAPVTNLPLVLISGFFVRISEMPDYLKPLANVSYLKYAFESILTILYGFDRCNLDPNPEVDKNCNPNLILLQLYKHVRRDLNISMEELKEFFYLYMEGMNKSSTKVDFYIQQLTSLNYITDIDYNSTELHSIAMEDFGLNDNLVYFNFVIMIILLLMLRIINFFVLYYKSNQTVL